MHAIIYARVSTAGQADDGLPVQSQIEACQAYAAERGAKVVKVFTDEGLSGFTEARPGFQEAVAWCETTRTDLFITWSSSRFARNHIDAGLYKRRLAACGTRVAYAGSRAEEREDDDEAWLMHAMLAIMDEQYSRAISKDTRRSMQKNARDGYWNGGHPPYGYTPEPDGKRKRLVVVEPEAAVVRRIYRMAIEGAGAKEIALVLNAEGLSRRGANWSKNTIANLLANPVYAGWSAFNRTRADRTPNPPEKWIMTKGRPEIIPDHEWRAVQEAIAARAPRIDAGSPHSAHLFTGILKCGACGAAMQIETATGRSRTYSYYHCRASLKGQGCRPRRLPADELDRWLADTILDRILTPEHLHAIVREIYELQGEWAHEREQRREALVAELRDAERRRDKLFEVLELHGKSAPNLGDLTARLRDLKKRIEGAEQTLSAIEAEELPALDITPEAIHGAATLMRTLIQDTKDPARLRAFFASFITRIDVGDSEVTINYAREPLILGPEKQNRHAKAAVHSERNWLPDLGLLRTVRMVVPMSDRLRRRAA